MEPRNDNPSGEEFVAGQNEYAQLEQDQDSTSSLEQNALVDRPPEGWLTSFSTAKGFGTLELSRSIAGKFREQHPEWFQEFIDAKGRVRVFYHPELVSLVRGELQNMPEKAPDGWQTAPLFAKEHSLNVNTVRKMAEMYRGEHPDWFETYLNELKRPVEHYHPDLIQSLETELQNRAEPPSGWMTANGLAKAVGRGREKAIRMAENLLAEHPEWSGQYFDSRGRELTFYSPELLIELNQSEANKPEEVPDGWLSAYGISQKFNRDPKTVLTAVADILEEHPDWSQVFTSNGRAFTYYHPDLISELNNRYKEIPDGWITVNSLALDIGRDYSTVNLRAEKFKDAHPEWFAIFSPEGRGSIEHIHPQLVEILKNELTKFEKAPEGWTKIKALAEQLGKDYSTIVNRAEVYRTEHPEWFSVMLTEKNRAVEHYSPELVAAITKDLSEAKPQASPAEDLRYFLSEVTSSDSLEAQEFRKLTEIFGGERAIDLVYQHHPEFAGVPVPQAKRIIGDYLGEFLVQRGSLQLEDLELAGKFLANPSLKEGLTEVVKQDCLRFYNAAKRANPEENDQSLLEGYITHLQNRTAGLENHDLNEVLTEVPGYYSSLFTDIHKPEAVIDELKANRQFPDINQRINIKELSTKQKILIADEMGLGKSASAILAKETLGAKQALVLVPSNVEETWSTYLSDRPNVGGQVAGYFKEGQAPRVLRVASLESLQKADPESYDYILMSQERLTDKYTEELQKFGFDMMVVDESHKLKNLSSGRRAENLVKLSEKIEGEDKYLALLSGTPIPNKVGDIAMTLRLLYPERFAEIPGNELVNQIINGDALDLRSLLVPRMQMKALAESVEMPKLTQEDRIIELSDQEKNIYDVLLQEDELTASEKLQILRQFVINPELLQATPDIEGSKVRAVRGDLLETFGDKDKVVMFVNGYMEGVIRGERTIIDQLDLPEEIRVMVIEGNVPKEQREQIRQELQTDGKMLLLVSGQTADVGVDFSAADAVRFFNEPWTEYEKRQQLSRVYRPGLEEDLDSKTFYVKDTVEEGIHYYIQAKYRAVEKLLRGIPVSEIEAEMLRKAEKQKDANLEVDTELAESYFSSFDTMMRIYKNVKEMGEEKFTEFLSKWGREYAEAYEEVGSRSYQANASRLAGTLITDFAKEQGKKPGEIRILDIASGPEMLRRHIPEQLAPDVISVDINEHHFTEATGGKRAVGSFLKLPIANSSVDYANLSLALHYTSFVPSRGNTERLEALQEINRVLKNGGRAVISLMFTLDVQDEQAFRGAVGACGFKVVEDKSGEAEAGSHFMSKVYTLEKTKVAAEDTRKVLEEMGKNKEGLKFKHRKSKMRDSARVMTEFILGGKKISAYLNAADRAILEEERQIMSEMEVLKSEHGEVKAIPADILSKQGISRILLKNTYVIFKRLQKGPGAIVYRDTTKWAESSEEDPARQGVAATAS